MALRNQPYLPLYVNDFITDEKLIRCSAETTGVYIRLMCQMHKSEEYGTFIIKEKDKKSDDIIKDFARVFSLYAPYQYEIILNALIELLDEKIIYIDKNKLCQKRMIKDNDLSEKRAESGKRGADIKYNNENICHSKNNSKLKANNIANAEYDNDNIYYNSNIELDNIFKEYLNVRKKLKAVNSERAINTLINKLDKYDDETKFKMIEQSIVNSWKDVYELKKKKETFDEILDRACKNAEERNKL